MPGGWTHCGNGASLADKDLQTSLRMAWLFFFFNCDKKLINLPLHKKLPKVTYQWVQSIAQ